MAVGAVVPCAGDLVVPAGIEDPRPYLVSAQMTLCPRTLADTLAVASDSALLVA